MGHNHTNEINKEIDKRKLAAQDDSVAADVEGIVADFNALLAKLRAAGLMEE